jgi:hypothetical protein
MMKPYLTLAILALACTARAIHIDGVNLNQNASDPGGFVEVAFSHAGMEGRDESDAHGHRPGDLDFDAAFNATAQTSGSFTYVGTWGFQLLLITWIEFDNQSGEILGSGLRYEGLSQEESDALLHEAPLLTYHTLTYDPISRTGTMRWANSPSHTAPVPETIAPLSLMAFGCLVLGAFVRRRGAL